MCLGNSDSKGSDKTQRQGLSAGPVADTLSSKVEGTGSIPGQGAEIPHASWPKKPNKNRSNIVMNKDVKKWSI